eukprot:1334985-Rhodomonas_salina.5
MLVPRGTRRQIALDTVLVPCTSVGRQYYTRWCTPNSNTRNCNFSTIVPGMRFLVLEFGV